VTYINSLSRLLKCVCALSALAALMAPPVVIAEDAPFQFKDVADFKRMDAFESPAAFDVYVDKYVQTCLAESGGGTGGIPCNVGDALWERELDTYYQKLLASLDTKSREQLKSAERGWITMRDQSIAFHEHLADLRIPKDGTMYLLLRSVEIHSTLKDLNKERTLLLKHWLELAHERFDD
jgi:uncharacterized protein YecT (DUF1311 family)